MDGFSCLADRRRKGKVIRDMVADTLQKLQCQRQMKAIGMLIGFAC